MTAGCLKIVAVWLKIVAECLKIVAECLKIVAGCLKIVAGCLKIVAGCLKIVAGCLKIVAECLKIVAECLKIVAECRKIVAECLKIVAECLKIVAVCLKIVAVCLTLAKLHRMIALECLPTTNPGGNGTQRVGLAGKRLCSAVYERFCPPWRPLSAAALACLSSKLAPFILLGQNPIIIGALPMVYGIDAGKNRVAQAGLGQPAGPPSASPPTFPLASGGGCDRWENANEGRHGSHDRSWLSGYFFGPLLGSSRCLQIPALRPRCPPGGKCLPPCWRSERCGANEGRDRGRPDSPKESRR